MFDQNTFENICKYNEFTCWFERIDSCSFICYPKIDRTEHNTITFNTHNIEEIHNLPEDIKNDFVKFQDRPEFEVGKPVDIDINSISANNQQFMIDSFETIIIGSAFIRARNAGKDPDEAFLAVTRFLDWVRSTDFYSCPGSTRFHDAEPNGLLFHSLYVYNNILDVQTLPKFNKVQFHSLALISLCHDFTKIGNYESFMRNVKNETTGQWEKVPSYRWKCNPFPFGHGVASMYILSKFFQLSMEEMLAIRWHMGYYCVSDREAGELEDAGENYPMVKMLQFADQLACVKY